MRGYFLDTSALAKAYRREPGSEFVDRLLTEPDATRYISRLAIVEMESVLALKLRIGELDGNAAATTRRRLYADLSLGLLLVASVRDEDFREARRLVTLYGPTSGLRSLDSIQLAVSNSLRNWGLVQVFVAADQKLCTTARLEGFVVMNPEEPVSV